MPRYKLIVEYDGTDFVGWQRQDNGLSIQQALEEAVEKFCGTRASVTGAGRTDSGVHALAQVAHVDLPSTEPAEVVRDAINHHLKPAPIALLAVAEVADDFHARFTAVGRHYRYRIVNRRSPLTLERGRAWWVPRPLDADAMAAAARCLVGHHDFTSFRASLCQAPSPEITLDTLDVTRDGDEITVDARARSFLHHQVRNIVGTLKLVGEGRWSADDVARALAARDRSAGGPTAPPEGLYLVEVCY